VTENKTCWSESGANVWSERLEFRQVVLPVRPPNGEVTERHHSITPNLSRRSVWEIAALQEDQGSGDSRKLHNS